MTTEKPHWTTEALKLKTYGKTWVQVSKELADKGYKNSKGRLINSTDVYSWRYRRQFQTK